MEKNIQDTKLEIVSEIKDIFNKNKFLSSYSGYLSTYFFDVLFEDYIQEYVNKIDENDIQTIKEIIEKSLDMKLNEFLKSDELLELYVLAKQYIHTLLINKTY